MPVNSLASPVQNPAETFRINQANNQQLREPSEDRKQSGTRDIITVEISDEARMLFEKAAEKQEAKREEVLKDREVLKEANEQVQVEQSSRQEQSRKEVDLFT